MTYLKNKIYFIILLALSVSLFFQNCGKVDIQPPSAVQASNYKNGYGFLCVPSGYTLDSFFITNLNTKYVSQGLVKDSDGDGLADFEEIELGYDHLNRRTGGKILDSICNDLNYGVDCAKFTLSCNLDNNDFGLNECDIIALNLNQSIQTGAGVDSDKDSVPDYLEIRIQSFPNLFDAYNDLDFDLVNTIGEGQVGTSTRHSNTNADSRDLIKISKIKLPNNTDCTSGEYWQVNVHNLPVLAMQAYNDIGSGNLDLSHGINQNLIFSFLKIKPINNPDANAKVFSGLQLVNYDENDVDTDFNFDQNILLPSGEVEQ